MADGESNNEDCNRSKGGKEGASEADTSEKKETGDTPDELMAKRIEDCSRSWVESASDVALLVMSAYSGNAAETSEASDVGVSFAKRSDDGKGQGDAEAEALTVVLSSFLLDLCQRYPEERNLLDRLVSLFWESLNDGEVSWTI